MFSIRVNRLRPSLKYLTAVQSLQSGHQPLRDPSSSSTVSNLILFHHEHQRQLPCSLGRHYCTEKFASKDPDVFGDIAGNKYEESSLDPDEEEQEEFEKNEATVPRRLKLSPGQYANLIKEHLAKRDLESAVKVLDLVKENRDQPTTMMYNLLLEGFAEQGDLRTAWKLFTSMKKRALKLNAATYAIIINACANSPRRAHSLECLEKIREEIMVKNVALYEVHYNTLVKAYGRHQCLMKAFKVVDQMIDNKVAIREATFNSLLYACISDKANGLRHALVVWHMMQRWSKKPDLITYNLMLRAIRDTKLGELKTNDVLLENYQASRILISDSRSPDLLANPPIVSKLEVADRSAEQPGVNPDGATKAVAVVEDTAESENFRLGEIHEKNKLILFGGFNGFLQRLEASGVQPDAKTMTLLLDVVPNSLAIERKLVDIARAKKIPLDIDFFNMLIKKRSFRKDYKHAKEVLDDIQRHNLVPDMITWGVLALGCQTLQDAQVLLEGLETSGHTLNTVIAGSLLGNACCNNRIGYVLEILQLMSIQRIRPSNHIFTILDKYKLKIENTLKHDRSSKLYRNEHFRQKFETFKNRYEKFQQKFQREENHQYIRVRKT